MLSKICTRCKVEKPLELYSNTGRGGKESRCKQCANEYAKWYRSTHKEECKQRVYSWRDRNPEKNLEISKACRQRNTERCRENNRKSRAKNADYYREKDRQWAKDFPHLAAAKVRKRQAAKLRATPSWADHEKIAKIYEECAAITKATGIKHEVDHYYPLQGKDVCGLHVHENLRVITKLANGKKHNHTPKD